MEPNELATLKEELQVLDEITLLDLLEITQEDIIERFEDKIIEYHEELKEAIGKENKTIYTDVTW